MTVLAHLEDAKNENFLLENLIVFAKKNPTWQLVFCMPGAPAVELPVNCVYVPVRPKLSNSLLLHYWYRFKINSIAARYTVDIFISQPGIAALHLDKPQILFYVPPKKTDKFRRYRKKFQQKFFNKATRIVIENACDATSIEKENAAKEKLFILPPFTLPDDINFSQYEIEKVQEQYSNGQSYFAVLLTGQSVAAIKTVLKAFSIFKRWQKSSMNLLLLDTSGKKTGIPDFQTYKYRNDVVLAEAVDHLEICRFLAGAYACIYITSEDVVDPVSLLSMCSGTVLICTKNNRTHQLFNDEHVIFTDNNEQQISNCMMTVYRNEDLKNSKARAASIFIRDFSASSQYRKFETLLKGL